MSDHTDTTSAAAESAHEDAKPKSNPARMIALLVLLAVVCFGYYYDRKIAKPNSEQAYETVLQLVDTKNTRSVNEDPITDEDVEEAIGFPSSSTQKHDHYTMQVFHWRRGLPILTYPVYVYYTHGKDGGLHLFWTSLHQPAEERSLPGTVIVSEHRPSSTDEAPATTGPPMPMGAGGPPEGTAVEDAPSADDSGTSSTSDTPATSENSSSKPKASSDEAPEGDENQTPKTDDATPDDATPEESAPPADASSP